MGSTSTHIAEAGTSGPAPLLLQQRRELSYPFEQVWPAAIRYLRVDRGYEIEDRDADAGYLMFKFPVERGEGHGALELVRVEDAAGRPSVSMAINTSAGPSHLPHTLLEGIAQKVRQERGQPAPPPKPPEAPPRDDDGDDSADPPDDGSPPMMPPPIDPGRKRRQR